MYASQYTCIILYARVSSLQSHSSSRNFTLTIHFHGLTFSLICLPLDNASSLLRKRDVETSWKYFVKNIDRPKHSFVYCRARTTLHLFVRTGPSRPLRRELSRQQGCRPIGTVRDHTYSGDSRHGSPTTFREYNTEDKLFNLARRVLRSWLDICIYVYIYRL